MIKIIEISSEATLPIRHQVLWPNKPIDDVRLGCDPEGHHFGLYVDDTLVSVISVFILGQEAQFRKFATLEAYQGKGYGSRLFEHILEFLDDQNITRIWCRARLDANNFYSRYSFTKTSDPVFYKGDVGYTIMEKR